MYNEKREKIIEIARNIFSRFGIKKSTMEEIAKRIRIGKSTLYHYFRSKQEIFLEVVKRESELMKQKIKEILDKSSTPQEKFRNYSKARIQYLRELKNYYSTLTDEYLEVFPFTKDVREDFTNFEISTLEEIFKEGIKKGVFRMKDPTLTAKMVIIAFKGFEYEILMREGKSNLVDTIDLQELDLLIEVFFKGIETGKTKKTENDKSEQ